MTQSCVAALSPESSQVYSAAVWTKELLIVIYRKQTQQTPIKEPYQYVKAT